MQYTDNEAALIGGLISNYFFQPSVDETLRESYRRVLRHLQENTLSNPERADIPFTPLSGRTGSTQGYDGRNIKNRRSAESQQINDLPLHRSGRFAVFSLR